MGSDLARRRAPGTGVKGTGAMWMKELCTTQPDALLLFATVEVWLDHKMGLVISSDQAELSNKD
jgi:hypothetical protein